MSVRAPLPQRKVAPAQERPPVPEAVFAQPNALGSPGEVAPDMGSLADRVRRLMAFQRGGDLVLPLGGHLFDIVVTASGPEAYGVVAMLDEIQRTNQQDRPDACGPVIEDPERGWLIWLVPPATSAQWTPHRYGACLGRPHQLALPPLSQAEPPGVFWRRRMRGDRLVPPVPLRDLLDRFRPGPVPHEALLGSVLSSIC
ncbi:hypothetical protein ACIRU3_44700 [Streptomyces sp. NPDC101151]|uniref:hypothetical protein n=1 Tax=Streptomyces sp. NPDC101151 TaxID=3366115 RepID=UPI0038086D42